MSFVLLLEGLEETAHELVVRELLETASGVTDTGADLLIEVGLGQASRVVSLGAQTEAWSKVDVYPDLQGIERVVHLRRI